MSQGGDILVPAILAGNPHPEQQKLQATISAQAHRAALEAERRDLENAQYRLLTALQGACTADNRGDGFIDRMFAVVAKCERNISCNRCRQLLTGGHT